MKKTASVLTVTFLAFTLAGAASAQTRPATEPTTPRSSEPQRQSWTPGSDALESGKVIGMKVKNSQNKDVGEISQLIVDQAGKVTHAVIGKGGVLGLGEQRVAVEWSDLKMQPDPDNRNRWIATVDQAKLDSAPRYEARRDTTPAASPATSPSSTGQPRPKN